MGRNDHDDDDLNKLYADTTIEYIVCFVCSSCFVFSLRYVGWLLVQASAPEPADWCGNGKRRGVEQIECVFAIRRE